MALERRGVDRDSRVLAEYWSLYLIPFWKEYGTSKANLLAGLVPPLSGSYGNAFYRPRVTVSDQPTALQEITAESLHNHGWKPTWRNLSGPVYNFGTFTVAIDYVDGPELRKDKAPRVIVKIYNTSHQAHIQLRWLGEEAVQISPARESSLLSLPHYYKAPLAFEFEFLTTTTLSVPCRFVLELVVGGQNKTMLIPVVFMNGNVRPVERQD